ncbi:MAG: hypothetical protein HUJ54_07810 [Erysipelotrichaceae bacterium]|nr:hypothetical protein [Erysipelotrichaceae bacterium]
MAKKKVYAALEIADQEVRLVVSEVFDGRSNILRVEKAACGGVKDFKITDEGAVVKAIQQVVRQAQNALGYKIERVLLAIPPKDIKRSSQKVHIAIEDGTNNIRRFHVQTGLKQAVQKKADDQHELVSINKILYTVNQNSSTKLPVSQEASAFDMEVDLLYADKETLYSYAKAVEEANLEILDICLDAFAQAHETAALAMSEDRPIILVSLEKNHTTLSLLMQSRIMAVTVLSQGFGSFIEELKEKYRFSDETAYRLLQNVFETRNDKNSDSIIYIEQQDDQRIELTARNLADSVLPKIRSWIAEVNAACEPIVKDGKARYMITGQGSNLPVMEKFEGAFNAPASVYKVTAIGARDGSYVSDLGMVYAWQEINRIHNDDRTSVNNNELEASIESINRYTKDEEGGFTQKLKRAVLSAGN